MTIPEEYKLQWLIALSYYPELHNKKFTVKYRRLRTTMSCRPKIRSLLRKKKEYNICINKKKHFKGILLKDVPFNAQIGVIGHELAHIDDYENKNSLKIIGTGLHYLGHKGKKKLEQKIDLLTIQKGLGWQLYDWSNYAINQSNATDKYKKFKRSTYLKPDPSKLK